MKIRNLSVLVIVLMLSACRNDSQYGNHRPFPAAGQVLVNGRPAEGVELHFFHDGDWGESTAIPAGTTDKDGKYVLGTFRHRDGAPIGHYFVRAEWPAQRKSKRPGPDQFEGKYFDPYKSGIEMEIQSGKNDLGGVQELLPEVWL